MTDRKTGSAARQASEAAGELDAEARDVPVHHDVDPGDPAAPSLPPAWPLSASGLHYRLEIGSRDSIHRLAGTTWQAIDYADGLVRVGVQSAIAHPDTSALIRKLMVDRGLAVPPEGRTLDSICITDICQPDY